MTALRFQTGGEDIRRARPTFESRLILGIKKKKLKQAIITMKKKKAKRRQNLSLTFSIKVLQCWALILYKTWKCQTSGSHQESTLRQISIIWIHVHFKTCDDDNNNNEWWRTLIGAVPMVTMAQSAPNWRITHTVTWIARIHSHTYINIATTTLCEAPAQLLQNLESNFFFEGTWGRGGKPEYPEKTPDSLPANRYHILEEKFQRHCFSLHDDDGDDL